MKHLRPASLLAAVALGTGLAIAPATAALAVPTAPDSPAASATTSSSAVLEWGMPCSGCDPDSFEVQAGAAGLPWTFSTTRPGYVGAGYRTLNTSAPGNFLEYVPTLPHAGSWTLQYNLPNSNFSNLVTSTTLKITRSGGTSNATMNQRANPGAGWQTIGTYTFDAGAAGRVRITNSGSGGIYVLADAFRWVDSTGITVTVDDDQATNFTWTKVGGAPGDIRRLAVGHLRASTDYGFRIRSVTAGVSSAWVDFPPVTTPVMNTLIRGTVVSAPGVSNPRNGEGDIIELSDGTLFYVYGRYEAEGDFAPSTIAAKTSSDGGRTWSAESILFGTIGGGQTYIQPGLVRLDADTIGISYVIQTESPAQAYRVFRTSDDDGATWTAPVTMTDGSSALITGANARLERLASGRLIQVVNLRVPTPDDRATGVYTSDDDGATWVDRTPTALASVDGFIEANLTEYAPDELLMIARTIAGPTAFLWESRSLDGGDTWSTPTKTNVPQPGSPAFVTTSPSGAILLITNGDTPEATRTILASRISYDEGRTWENYKQIEYLSPTRASYPVVRFTSDGAHILYSAPVGSKEASHLALPADWFETVESYPYAPTTIAHIDGADVTFLTVSGGQGTVATAPRVTLDGDPVTATDGRYTLGSGTHTLAWSAIDSGSREEVWRSVEVTN
ncbi:MAG: exo-alpha-sialidase [Microbacterium sp.]|nr:exo-alpha-sialidase [Microbacterium sp.]